MSEAPIVYLIYGTPDSGRREVLFDLIGVGIPSSTQVLYFRPTGEAESEFDTKIGSFENVSIIEWQLAKAKVAHGQITAAPEVIFFMAPGTSDPADVAEALKTWADHNQCEIGRILTVINCSFLIGEPAARSWHDACIHFSDVILLNRREHADNKWIKTLEQDYQKLCSPARFIFVKKGRVPNPVEILNPEVRRLSLYFDELLPIDEDGLDEEEQPDDTKPDKYIERLENGHRAHKIPDITKCL